jgi:hypothetical protein
MVDRPDEHGPALAVDTELCPEVRPDHVPTRPPGAGHSRRTFRLAGIGGAARRLPAIRVRDFRGIPEKPAVAQARKDNKRAGFTGGLA